MKIINITWLCLLLPFQQPVLAQLLPGPQAFPIPTQAVNPVPLPYPAEMRLNYIKTWEPQYPVTGESEVQSNTTPGKVKLTIQYFDGLGKPLQSVKRGFSPGKEDVILPFIYDIYGNESFKYLPFIIPGETNGNAAFNADPFKKQKDFYLNAALNPELTYEKVYYGNIEYEPAPSNRPLLESAPGNSWTGSNRGNQFDYDGNTVDDHVKLFRVSAAEGSIPSISGEFPAGQLEKFKTINENGYATIVFKDRNGHPVLTKKQFKGTGSAENDWLCTYQVYDDLNRLRYIVSPQAVKLFTDRQWQHDANIYTELCFRFEYDKKGRIVVEKKPGNAEDETVYDVRNRPVFKRTGRMAPANGKPGIWNVTFYDDLNRPVMTALYHSDATRLQLQQAMDAQSVNKQLSYTIPPPKDISIDYSDGSTTYTATNSITFNSGFESPAAMETSLGASSSVVTIIEANNPLPTIQASQLTPLSYNYYDDYSFPGAKPYRSDMHAKMDYVGGQLAHAVTLTDPDKLPRNNVTGTRIRLLNTDQWLTSTLYYDKTDRIQQIVKDNALGGEDILTTQYNFSGQVIGALLHHHNAASKEIPVVSLLSMLEYDHSGRLINTFKKVWHNNTAIQRNVAKLSYTPLGKLKRKEFLRGDQTILESLEYSYNIRDWITGVNKAYTKGLAVNFFGQEISYDFGFPEKKYNGTVSGIIWKGKVDPKAKAYGFRHDGSDRILQADFSQQENGTWAQHPNVNYNFKLGDGINADQAYDQNGNILKMEQWGQKGSQSAMLDQLTYQYQTAGNMYTNRLQKVNDAANDINTALGDFKDLNPNAAVDFDYDPSGNIIADKNRDISITYNHLNLPDKITLPGRGTMEFVYDAAGHRHKKTVTKTSAGGNTITTTSFAGDLVFTDGELSFIGHEEGRIRPLYASGKMNGYTFDYFIRDHINNVRMVLTEQSNFNVYAATMETSRDPVETATFSNITASRSDAPANLRDSANKFVAKLHSQKQKTGPGIVLRVMAGDTININTEAFYKSQAPGNGKPGTPEVLTQVLSQLAQIPAQLPADKGIPLTNHLQSENNRYVDAMEKLLRSNRNENADLLAPKAYLNYALFTDKFELISENSGVKAVKQNPDEQQQLQSGKMEMKASGFMYVYVNNESSQDVMFDNLQLTHSPGPVLEENHFYPFGLIMDGLSSKAMMGAGYPENKLKFTGQHHDDDFGLNTYQMKWRTMDPQTGRFLQTDPISSQFPHNSTYAYAENKVMNGIDLEGKEWYITYKADQSIHITVNVIFTNGSKVELTPQQIAAYQKGISDYLNKTFMASSNGKITAEVKYGTKETPKIVTPRLNFVSRQNDKQGGNTVFAMSTLNLVNSKNELRSVESVSRDGAHELLHTLRLEHPYEITQGNDLEMVRTGRDEYVTTPNSAKTLSLNIMNYPHITIDGVKLGNLWSNKPQLILTGGQINRVMEEIKMQSKGMGHSTHPSSSTYWGPREGNRDVPYKP